MKRVDLIRTITGFGCDLVRHGAKHDWYRNSAKGLPVAQSFGFLPRDHRRTNRLTPTGATLPALNWCQSRSRENVLMPIGEENGILQIVMSNPTDYDTILKVQFILARDIQLAVSPKEPIVVAINRHYG